MTEQELKLIDLKILKLAQQQDDLNSVLGQMLSTAECLSNRFGVVQKESKFQNYNLNNAGNTKNEKRLKTQLKIQTKIFRNNHKYMVNKDKKYPFPDNFGKNDIIKIVNIWKSNSKKENYIYFDNIINVLNGKYDLLYPDDQINDNQELPPEKILQIFPKAMEYVDQKREETWKNVEKTGKYINELKIGIKKNENINNDTNFYDPKNNELKMLKLFDKTYKKAENFFVKATKNINYLCQFGYMEEYNKINNTKNLEQELINDINYLSSAFEKYCTSVNYEIPEEFYKYQIIANNWSNMSNHYIFIGLKKIFI